MDSDDRILEEFAQNDRFVDALCNASMTRICLDRSKKSYSTAGFTTTSRHGVNESTRTSGALDATPSTTRLVDPMNSEKQIQQTALTTQISEESLDTLDNLFNKYFLCLQTLSTCESGVYCLCSKLEIVIQLFNEYLEKCISTFNDWEIKSSHSLKSQVGEESLQNLICVLSVLNSIFSDNQSDNLLDLDRKYPNFFLKLFTMCKCYLSLINEIKKSSTPVTDSASTETNFDLIKSNITELIVNVNPLTNADKNSNINHLVQTCFFLLNQ